MPKKSLTKNNKRKSKKQKKTIKNRNEARKYIELLNLAYKQITSSWHDIFNKDDYLLLPYLKQGIKKGWKILKDKNIIKEIKCNSLCMTISILNDTIGKKSGLEKLSPVQQLYLFFISYLIDDKNLSNKQVSLKHAIRKLDIDIMKWSNKLIEYEKRKDNRNIKKCKRYLDHKESLRKQLIDGDNSDKERIISSFNIDVCNAVDCEFLQEYKMEKGKKWSETYSKFCFNITEIFKGIVWLNIYSIFKDKKIKGLSPYMNEIEIEIPITLALNRKDIILLPDSFIYESDIFYDNRTIDQSRKRRANDPDNPQYWVYHNYNIKTGSIDKRSLNTLDDKHYVAAMLSIPYKSSSKSPDKDIQEEMFVKFQEFLHNKGDRPVLKGVYKTTREISGEEKYDLREDIENSITLHWIYIHKNRLTDFINIHS